MAVVSIPTAAADDTMKPQVSVPKADDKAEQILRASHDYLAARSVEIEQTIEQTVRVLVDGKPMGSEQATKQTSPIEIDANKGLVRMITKDQSGKDLVVIRKGDRIAMKIGLEPWTAPKVCMLGLAINWLTRLSALFRSPDWSTRRGGPSWATSSSTARR